MPRIASHIVAYYYDIIPILQDTSCRSHTLFKTHYFSLIVQVEQSSVNDEQQVFLANWNTINVVALPVTELLFKL